MKKRTNCYDSPVFSDENQDEGRSSDAGGCRQTLEKREGRAEPTCSDFRRLSSVVVIGAHSPPRLLQYFFSSLPPAFYFNITTAKFLGEDEQERFLQVDDSEPFLPIIGKDFVAAVLVVCATRPEALRNHLTQLLAKRPSASQFPVVISQDGETHSVHQVASKFISSFKNVTFMRHKQEKILKAKKRNNYAAIAKHYKWALDRMFKKFGFNYVIITEDDLDIGNDFFSYFEWAKRVLQTDPTLWCASAWNDNGLPKLIDENQGDRIWRTDFFPGLGWMLSAETWNELSDKWPGQYWDDWMRQQDIRKNRSCIRPEICRTAHNMRLAGKGSSGGMFKSYLSSISAAHTSTEFSLIPVQKMVADQYNKNFVQLIQNAKLVDIEKIATYSWEKSYEYRVPFNSVREWHKLATHFGLMPDIRGGMQRTSYHGVVSLMHNGCRIYIVPFQISENATLFDEFHYDPNWDKKFRFLEFEKAFCKPGKFTGTCDPKNPELIAWFKKKSWQKRLAEWGDMIVN
ncbi:unnamed protein product [Caenorhabditis auriculariae]|uniref:Alpha-1,3-mannosyl-glycoprotein 2-beta-N-acetylglucosaminyltransferase n=1 Tax=Caenorhabditis auriculariae TaxID=2777116 RepID=A0A8S1H1X3_9PELO|nr:unnamed protein product [Caenorhabditis auriculariae]